MGRPDTIENDSSEIHVVESITDPHGLKQSLSFSHIVRLAMSTVDEIDPK